MNIKKLFATLAGVSLFAQTVVPSASVFGAGYSQELEDAYNWAYGKSITTMSPIENANMYGAITRAEMAKMLANWAKDKGETPDTSKACNFSDTASVKGDLATAIVEACQLGLMGQGITSFRPYDTISRAEFGTALSRALWGNKYEGGTPYYTNHLNALKAAGIMTQIANAESTKEVRGYVMLMLMRSEGGSEVSDETDCDDPLVVLACNSDSDACPAACKEDSKEDTVVRSGDLSVTAEAAEGRKVLANWVSDLDTLTFKTSENVEINKITLETYGYTDDTDTILGIWLEDEDGNIIADSKTITKDKVTLSIKKDYRKVDGEYVATIVVETKNAKGTMWFKVTDVDSTAKNLNVDNYKPYTYEVIEYTGSAITVEVKGSDKDYNYEEGNSYEIARLRVKANTKDIVVKGFTLTNDMSDLTTAQAAKYANVKALDVKEFLDELTVTVDSKEVKAKASVNKDDELVVTFNEDIEIAMNKSAMFVLSASFKDFDAYGDAVKFYLAETSDFNAVEVKNDTRVTFNKTANNSAFNKDNAVVHQFAGGKIKLSNKKLGNVDAAQNSEGTVVAEWDITVTEPLSKIDFTIYAKLAWAQYIDSLTMAVNGEEYEVNAPKVIVFTAGKTAADYSEWDILYQAWATSPYFTVKNGAFANLEWVPFNFKNVDIEKSWKIQFKVDIKDNSNAAGNIEFTTFGKAQIAGAKYDNVSRQTVKEADVAGSISFSKVTIQKAKAALENNLTKDVEFLQNETNRKVVFDGTYTAKKGGDIDLNKFAVVSKSNPFDSANGDKVTFYLFIDGEEVADTDILGQDETFSDVRVKAGESVKVKVEAEVEAYKTWTPSTTAAVYELQLKGTDTNGNEDTGNGSETMVNMKIKAKGSVTIPSSSEAKTALLKAQNTTIAKFTVKPSNGNEWITLEDLKLTIAGTNVKDTNDNNKTLYTKDLRVKVGGVEQDDPTADEATSTYSVNEEIPTEGIVVEVTLKPEVSWKVDLTVVEVNQKGFGTVYSKYLVDSLVSFVKQDEGTTSTEYELNVENSDDAYSVKNFKMYACGTATEAVYKCMKNNAEVAWKTQSECTGETGTWTEVTPASDGMTIVKEISEVSENETFTIMRGDKAVEICKVVYEVKEGASDKSTVTLTKDAYKDYFKVNGKELAIPKA